MRKTKINITVLSVPGEFLSQSVELSSRYQFFLYNLLLFGEARASEDF
jgi:hypothetical protein